MASPDNQTKYLKTVNACQNIRRGFQELAALFPGPSIVVIEPRHAGEVFTKHVGTHVWAGNSFGEDLKWLEV
jgi:hypothetical protein